VRLRLRSGFDLDRLGAIEHRANKGRRVNGVSRRVLMWVAYVRLESYEGRTNVGMCANDDDCEASSTWSECR
jgi:hypothetical protein